MMANAIVTTQPGAAFSPDSPKTGQWSSSVCDCCEDMGICCFGFWCPCCLMCKTSKEFGECLCLPLLEMFFGSGIPPVTYALRSSIRERYRIRGSMCDDCCMATCCGICVWCQMARELKYRRQPQVFVNAPVNPSYHPPQPYGPPYGPVQPQPMGQYPPAAH
ncbi:plac8 onzin related protein 6 [Brachyhypopomus gauderio]|uniref:plac8 onzin related protein 6 n=1 Tax=Brachyhypopomus gauderio TaxID=698409 RepID=UPI00404202AF